MSNSSKNASITVFLIICIIYSYLLPYKKDSYLEENRKKKRIDNTYQSFIIGYNHGDLQLSCNFRGYIILQYM